MFPKHVSYHFSLINFLLISFPFGRMSLAHCAEDLWQPADVIWDKTLPLRTDSSFPVPQNETW